MGSWISYSIIQSQNYVLAAAALLVVAIYAAQGWRYRKENVQSPVFSLTAGIVLTAVGITLHKQFWGAIRWIDTWGLEGDLSRILIEYQELIASGIFSCVLIGYLFHLHAYMLTKHGKNILKWLVISALAAWMIIASIIHGMYSD